ncbi:zinc finger BED domain-containing protein 1 [Elysia marginata]|uniref:Zinc finger BED domain-containing protein 1 n=1 Tax=Elysia marginata TaxID=1093978 RepID=A0AAV4EJ89_9GAST|nr:zinc finger BED domain-containing protein 1 [Elysia marginata]
MLPCNRKNASSIWSMMTKSGPGLAKCNLCGQEFKCSKGTSNLLRHVKSKHGTDSDVLAKVEGKNDQTPGSLPHKSLALQPTIEAKMSSIAKYRPEAPKKKALDKKLLCMIYRDMQPFSIVDDAGFKDFCKEMDPRYELPSRRQLKRSLSTVYEEEKNLLADQLSRVDSVAITTDSWTSLNMQSFLTITAHYLEPLPSWQLRNVVLATRLLDKDQLGSSAEGMSNLISELRTGEFVVGAADNIDHNQSSTTSTGPFHGTGVSLFQNCAMTLPNPRGQLLWEMLQIETSQGNMCLTIILHRSKASAFAHGYDCPCESFRTYTA